jgi:hypothetical protein
MDANLLDMLLRLSCDIMKDLKRNSTIEQRKHKGGALSKFQTFYPSKSKSIIDKIDQVLAQHYGFTDEELDFIINYDIKYRMGDQLLEEESEEE